MLLSLTLSLPAHAVDVFVDTSTELAAAMAHAPVSPGSSPDDYQIWLMPGVYDLPYVDLDDKALSLHAVVPGQSSVRGSTANTDRMLRIRGDTVFASYDVVYDGGGAPVFDLANNASATFQRTWFRNATSVRTTRGGVGTLNTNGSLTLEACRLEGGSTPDDGGLLQVRKGALTIRDSWLERGYAEARGGCVFVDDGSVSIIDTTLFQCGAGAIRTPTADPDDTELGGAIHLTQDVSSATFERVVIDSSRSRYEGGAIYSRTGLSLADSVVCRNVSTDYTGAGVFTFNETSDSLQIERSMFMGNASPVGNGHWGTVLRLEGDGVHTVTLQDLAFIANEGAGAPALWSGVEDDQSSLLFTTSLLAFNEPSNDVDAWTGAAAPHTFTDSNGWPDLPGGLRFTISGMTNVDPGFPDPGPACDLSVVVPTAGVPGPFLPGGIEDLDQDGMFAPRDCHDADAALGPGVGDATCDGIDDDCDGRVDEDASLTAYFLDEDGDGQGSSVVVMACGVGPHVADNAFDCDDTDPTHLAPLYWANNDGDTTGGGEPVGYCTPQSVPAGWLEVGGDCDDTDPLVYPLAPELCDGLDNDCDEDVDEGAPARQWWVDADGDGFGAGIVFEGCVPPADHIEVDPLVDADCDDADPDAFPDNPEVCDGTDNDCNLVVDDGVEISYWGDVDNDGYGAGDVFVGCVVPAGSVAVGPADCDDADATLSPDQDETCDGIDNDCDLVVDNGVQEPFAADADGDGFTDDTIVFACTAPAGLVAATHPVDCDDSTTLRAPNLLESCDGLDNDCDEQVDELLPFRDIVIDADGDGYGAPGSLVEDTCATPTGALLDPGLAPDCDDTNPLVNPGFVEVCDGVDNDCDLSIDEDGEPAQWFVDADGDGAGSPDDPPIASCHPIAGRVQMNDADCDDDDATVLPGAPEVECNGLDNDCDGQIDEEAPIVDGYTDDDGDGFGGGPLLHLQCPSTTVGDDCDDADPTVNPGAAEVCGPIDTNCNGQTGDIELQCTTTVPTPVLPPPPRGCTCDAAASPRWFTWLQRRR